MAGFDVRINRNVKNNAVIENVDELCEIIKDYSYTIFIGCIFTGFTMEHVTHSIFINCYFDNLKFQGNIIKEEFDHCTFRDVTVSGTWIVNCKFDDCIFLHSIINRSRFEFTNIINSTFDDLIITNCTFSLSTKFDQCDFFLNNSTVIMNSVIRSEITHCNSFNNRKQIYLYKCKFDTGGVGIHDNEYIYTPKLYETNLIDNIRKICPEEGSFICYKKLVDSYKGKTHMSMEYGDYDIIATLEIPADAKRVSTATRKCRAEYAKVIKLETFSGEEVKVAFSQHKINFKYTVGQEVHPDSFDDNPLHECSNGIHFFMTKAEAIRY